MITSQNQQVQPAVGSSTIEDLINANQFMSNPFNDLTHIQGLEHSTLQSKSINNLKTQSTLNQNISTNHTEYDLLMQKERELIKELLELHALTTSLTNNSLNLYDLISSSSSSNSSKIPGSLKSTHRQLSETAAASSSNETAVGGEATGHGEAGAEHGQEHEEHAHDTTKLDVVLFMLLCMFVGQLFKQFASWSGIPYTSLITILGVVLGIYYESLGRLGVALKIWSQIDPHLLLLLFLPALIFESAFNSDWHIFKVEMVQVLLMAGPMLLVSTGLSALMMRYILQYDGDFTFTAALLFGSIISATDPVAVVVLLKELGASRRLATLIEGESLLNDGTAMVVFLVIIDIVKGQEPSVGDIFIKFCRLSIGGPLLGIVGGMIVSFMLKRIHNNFILEVNTTIFSSYLIFFLAESTPVHVSGILALVALGLYMTRSGKTRISAESEHSVHHVWGYIGFVAETVIFILTGLIMGQRAVSDSTIGGWDVFKLVVGTYPILHVIRFLIILMFWPCLSKLGYGLTFKQVLLVTYAGLRGAVGMSLALMVSVDEQIHPFIRDVILLHVAGIALMTLLINATTTGPLVKYLGLSKQSDLQKNILFGLTYKLEKDIDRMIIKLQDNRHFDKVDWKKLKESVSMSGVKEKLKNFKNLHLDGEQAMLDYAINNDIEFQNLDIRIKQAESMSATGSVIQKKVPSALENITNMHKFDNANETFKGLKKKNRFDLMAPVYRAVNMPDEVNSLEGAQNQTNMPNNIPIYQQGRTNVQELMSELRHKYLTILKSIYWEFFEEGQCGPDSVIILIESADRCMDDESQPFEDWEFIQTYLISNSTLRILGGVSQVPMIGNLFRQFLFDHMSLSYDVIVNFIEAHDKADTMLQAVIESKDFVGQIMGESRVQVKESEEYMEKHIEQMFPEIVKAIQHRRAEYYLLVHEYHEVEKMLKHGQIEDKDAGELKSEIDSKIFFLTMNQPEIQFVGDNQRIIYYSELSEIFDREQLHQAVENFKEKFTEDIFEPKKQILSKGQKFNDILYVARGTVVEKSGEYADTHVSQLKFTKGRIACLQNLLPSREENELQISDLYCHHSTMASVAPLDLKYLKHILEKDEVKLLKLWDILAPRMIILHPESLPQFLPLTMEKIKLFCKMSDLRIYRPGDPVDMRMGGIMFRGGLSKATPEIKLFHQQLDDANKLDISNEFDIKQDIDDFRKQDELITPRKAALQRSLTIDHTRNVSVTQMASKKFIEKKKALHNLGNMMKKIGKQNLEDSEIEAVQFIIPDERNKNFVARSKDYVIIMHLGESLQGKIFGQKLNEYTIDEAYTQFTLMKNNKDKAKNVNFPSDIEQLEYGKTYQKQSKSLAKDLIQINRQGSEFINLPKQAKAEINSALKKQMKIQNMQSVVPKRTTLYPGDINLQFNGKENTENMDLLTNNNLSTQLNGNGHANGTSILNNKEQSLIIDRNGTSATKNGMIKQSQPGFSNNLRVPAMASMPAGSDVVNGRSKPKHLTIQNSSDDLESNSLNLNGQLNGNNPSGVTNGRATAGHSGIQNQQSQLYNDEDTDREMEQIDEEGDVKVKHVDV